MTRSREHGTRWPALCALALAAGTATAGGGCAGSQRAQHEREIAALRAQIAELKKSQETSVQALARLTADTKALDAQSTFLGGEVKAASDEMVRLRAALNESNNAIRTLRSAVEDPSKPGPAAVAPATPAPSSAPAVSPEQIYAAAMANFQSDEYGQAVAEWSELTQRFPEHPLAASAQYWIGEAYYRKKDFRPSLLEFRKVIDGYPKSPQSPEALLKIGLCYQALKDGTHAREVWGQLTKQYPGTNAAAQARLLLAAPLPSAR